MNLVQKGAFGDAQWKLQIDDGELGCRVADEPQGPNNTRNEAFAIAPVDGSGPGASPLDVFDYTWREFSCVKTGDTVAIFVDDIEIASDTASIWNDDGDTDVASSFDSIESDRVLSVGGLRRTGAANLNQVNDQYHGEMDKLTIAFR